MAFAATMSLAVISSVSAAPVGREVYLEELKERAYKLETSGQWKAALGAWNQALAIHRDGEAKLGVARTSIEAGDRATAERVLLQVEPSTLNVTLMAEYWSLKSRLAKETDRAAALDAIGKAIALEDAAYRRSERAEILTALGRREDALADLQIAHRSEPSNGETALSLAYALNEATRHGEAAAMFERASAAGVKSGAYLEDWGYALLAAGRREEAAEKFKRAIDLVQSKGKQRDTDERVWAARRENYYAERETYALASFNYRSGASAPGAVLSGESFLQSAFGLEVGWLPFGLMEGKDLTFYASAFFAFADDRLQLDRDTPQGALGVRWQPLREHELFFSVERLIELGEASREGWLTGISFSASEGAEWNPSASSWLFASIDAFANYLWDRPRAFTASAQTKVGHAVSLGYLWTLTPHVLLAAEVREDAGSKSSFAETGGGLSLRHWFCNDHYAGPLCRAELTVQYRYTVAREGVAIDDNAILTSVSIGL